MTKFFKHYSRLSFVITSSLVASVSFAQNAAEMTRILFAPIIDGQSLVEASAVESSIEDILDKKLRQTESAFHDPNTGMKARDVALPSLDKVTTMVQHLVRGPNGVTVLEREMPGEFPFLEIYNSCHAYVSGDASGTSKVQLGVLSERDSSGELGISSVGFTTGPGFYRQPEGYVAKTYFGVQKLGSVRGMQRNWISSPTSQKFVNMMNSGKASIGGIRVNELGDEIYADVSFKGGQKYKITVGRGKHKVDGGEWRPGTDVYVDSPEGGVNITLMLMGHEIWDGSKALYEGTSPGWATNYDTGGRAVNHVSGGVAGAYASGSHGCLRGGVCLDINSDLASRKVFLEALQEEAPKLREMLQTELQERYPEANAELISRLVDLNLLKSFGVKGEKEREALLDHGALTRDKLNELLLSHVKYADQLALTEFEGRHPGESWKTGARLEASVKNYLHEAAFRKMRETSFFAHYSPITEEELSHFYQGQIRSNIADASQELNRLMSRDLSSRDLRAHAERAAIEKAKQDENYKKLSGVHAARRSALETLRADYERSSFGERIRMRSKVRDQERAIEDLESSMDAIVSSYADEFMRAPTSGFGSLDSLMDALKSQDSEAANTKLTKKLLDEEKALKTQFLQQRLPGISNNAIKSLLTADAFRKAHERELGVSAEDGRFQDFRMPEEHKNYLRSHKAEFYTAYLKFLEREYVFRDSAKKPECNAHIAEVRAYLADLGGPQDKEILAYEREHAPIETAHEPLQAVPLTSATP